MRYLLYPFSILYGLVVGFRNFLFDYNFLKSREYEIPIISVGNISVGGTGKTPHTEYLVSLLLNEYKVAVLSRGYKRKTKGFLEVKEEMSAIQGGDEPLQIKRKFPQVKVVVDEKRTRGIKQLLLDQSYKSDVILLDDAYQHRYVKPGISVLLVDYNRLITKDFLLPFGRLRESSSQKSRADIIIITKCPQNLSPIARRIYYKDFKTFAYQNLFFTRIKYENLVHIYNNEIIELNSDMLKQTSVFVITGIANSKHLIKFLKDTTKEVIHKKYPDHYRFKKTDFEKLSKEFNKIPIKSKIIITTEKDSVRFDGHADDFFKNQAIYKIPVKVDFLNEDAEEFNRIIRHYVSANKRKKLV